MASRIGYGVVAWAVPYATAMPLMWLLFSDERAFKTVMIVEGSIVGAVLACSYFSAVRERFVREGVLLGATMLLTNWALDLIALVPFADVSVWRYFVEIGFRYVGMFATTVALGYALGTRLEGRVSAPGAVSRAA
jgi:hypothetical protein